jgi:hypothetical protein
MLFVLDAVALELELLSAEFVFVFVFVFPPDCLSSADFLCAKEFCITGTILNPTTSIDVIAASITIPLIVWFIFLVISISS